MDSGVRSQDYVDGCAPSGRILLCGVFHYELSKHIIIAQARRPHRCCPAGCVAKLLVIGEKSNTLIIL